jgi:hypothetical protein
MMKNVLLRLMTIAAFSVITVTGVAATAYSDTTGMYNLAKPATKDAGLLLERLKQISEMDKTVLTGSEKKQLRKEVRELKKEMRETSKGVYLSVGAIIIIILLLILIL